MASTDGEAVANELKSCEDTLKRMKEAASSACNDMASHSFMELTYVRQIRHLLQKSDWKISDEVVDNVCAHFYVFVHIRCTC